MISLKNVSKTYRVIGGPSVKAVREVDLCVERGEFVVITGRSGSGKTTLLNLAAGLTRPSSGEVWFEGSNFWDLTDDRRSRLRNHKIGCVFQFPSLLASLTTIENLVLPTMFGGRTEHSGVYERASGLLAEVGLADKQQALPRQLSAGQQQRAVIARALMNYPELLLADEPTSDLDEHTEQEIMALFKDIHGRQGVTIVLVTHTSQLASFGTRSVRMAEGIITSDTKLVRQTVP